MRISKKMITQKRII